MALRRPAPKTLTDAEQKTICDSSAQQTGKSQRVKSYDPTNYPVFDVPINQKLLVYIPNHTVMLPDGSAGLRMDKFAAHPVLDGRNYEDVRCSNGVIVDSLGLDGTCPLCNGITDCWSLYNHEYADIAKSKGIDPNSPDAQEGLKQDRIDLINKFAVKQAEVWYTFPLILIECEEKDGQLTTTPKKDAEGRIKGKPMWYSIRERTYLDKWVAGFDSIDTADGIAPTSPAGLWAVLNFTYTPKSGNHDKMGSARALKVTFKEMSGYGEWASYFDQLTQDWTPAKAQEVVVLDAVRSMEEMVEVADHLLKGTREKLAMYSLSAGSSVAPQTAIPQQADNALSSFGGDISAPTMPAGAPPMGEMPSNLTGEMPNVGVQA